MTTNVPLDYETKTLYRLIIEGTDAPPSGSVRTGTMTLVINVDPENEYNPMIQGEPLIKIVRYFVLTNRNQNWIWLLFTTHNHYAIFSKKVGA